MKIIEIDPTKKLSIIPLTVFPVFPFVSVILFSWFILLREKINDRTFYVFFILLATFLGLVNGTKIPESDLVGYFEFFSNVRSQLFY